MFDTKNLTEAQIWKLAMIVFPFTSLMNAGKEMADNFVLEMTYGLLFGGSGAVLGFLVFYYTKDQNRWIKSLGLLGLIAICVFTLNYAISSSVAE